jgi:hypothetical protein
MSLNTHTQQLKADFTSNKKQVMWLTKTTEEQYNNFIVDTGKAFFEAHYKQTDWDAIAASKSFWKWWFYNWNLIDDKYILSELYYTNEPNRYSQYRAMHQYVFDEDNANQRLLIADFLSIRNSFLPNYYPEGEE